MKIKLDRTMCDGFGACAMHAPATFSLDEWGYVSLVGTGEVVPEHEAEVRRALLDCPVHAIIELADSGDPDAEHEILSSQVGSSYPRELQAAAQAGKRLSAGTGGSSGMTNENPFGV
ncbi:hypothetical protein GEV29_02875 [Aeromicrobium sp. SMF47]|uniref:Uncharacterized protein n=1 Tax=Aeromicrobium yanjiei TaxID=2662028 RepID=A0A5Q2MIH2_9ACTN|nr:ferredoxin [Aeromicrobium yanjiei]MRJ75468.1 hypothetical protein [Aeromicrobium yanjiei]QGG40105.1 hypothetical protein GEV26_01205 [Aeromicrobium yanjiei]